MPPGGIGASGHGVGKQAGQGGAGGAVDSGDSGRQTTRGRRDRQHSALRRIGNGQVLGEGRGGPVPVGGGQRGAQVEGVVGRQHVRGEGVVAGAGGRKHI